MFENVVMRPIHWEKVSRVRRIKSPQKNSAYMQLKHSLYKMCKSFIKVLLL